MLTLLTFAGDSEQPSFSPFCLKAMCLLQMSGMDWVPEVHATPAKMPLRRLPVLKTGKALIADTSSIQRYLQSRGARFHDGMDQRDETFSHALIRMIDEHLVHGLVHDRWVRDDCWTILRDIYFAPVPTILRKPVSALVRRKVERKLTAHGIAQFSEQDRLERLSVDLRTLEDTLDGKPFLFGDAPTAADAAAVPVLDMIRNLPCDTGLRRLVRDNPALSDYARRGRAAIYPG